MSPDDSWADFIFREDVELSPHITTADFPQMCDLVDRLNAQQEPVTRSRVGAMDIIHGHLTDDRREPTRVTICVDPASGGGLVMRWHDRAVVA